MMPETSALLVEFEFTTLNEIDAISNDHVLGLHYIGAEALSNVQNLPTQRIAMPILSDDADLLYELWSTTKSCYNGKFQDIAFRATDTVLFGVLEIDESTLGLDNGESTLRAATEIAYRQIFLLLDAKNFTHLWRVWNYLPDIHAEECGLERYRQFNIGRHHAFVACDRSVNNSPAASALGVTQGVFSVAFIAGRTVPTRIENPRQISAFAYPIEYGPRSPAFTRAAVVANGEYETLFISGTASIVGHETTHHGDVVAQTQETIANLAALLEQANTRAQASVYALENLIYRVYIRNANDYPQVRQVLDAAIGNSIRVIYVQAEICRQDLLIEIEALAIKPLALDNA